MRKLALDDDILLNIEKPARYIGHEVNSVMKDKNAVGYKVCNVFSGGTIIVKQRFAHIISCSLTESFTFMEKEIIWDYVRL